MKYLQKSFTVGTSNSDAYRESYDRIFSKKNENHLAEQVVLPDPIAPRTESEAVLQTVDFPVSILIQLPKSVALEAEEVFHNGVEPFHIMLKEKSFEIIMTAVEKGVTLAKAAGRLT